MLITIALTLVGCGGGGGNMSAQTAPKTGEVSTPIVVPLPPAPPDMPVVNYPPEPPAPPSF